MCAYTGTRGHHEAPLFSDDEECKGEKFDLFNVTIGKDAGGPEACVGIEVTGAGSNRVRFSAKMNVVKVPPRYPADHGRGVGFAPIEGAAVWGPNGWTLRQMFKPKRWTLRQMFKPK